MGDTNITWTEKVWNPTRGCERVSEGCRNCYAEQLAARYSYPGGWGEGLAKWVDRPDGTREARWTGVLRTIDRMLDAPLHWREPRRIFVNSMSDLFHEDVPDEFIDRVFWVMMKAAQHQFQILTKRPHRMQEYVKLRAPLGCESPWVNPSVWLGVSVEDQATADERIPLLLQTPAAVRWISAEPMLGPIHIRTWMSEKCADCGRTHRDEPNNWVCPAENQDGLDWVVTGGESGPRRREMDMDHARALIQQCKAAGVPIFVKQDNGIRPGMQGRFTAEEWALKEYPA